MNWPILQALGGSHKVYDTFYFGVGQESQVVGSVTRNQTTGILLFSPKLKHVSFQNSYNQLYVLTGRKTFRGLLSLLELFIHGVHEWHSGREGESM